MGGRGSSFSKNGLSESDIRKEAQIFELGKYVRGKGTVGSHYRPMTDEEYNFARTAGWFTYVENRKKVDGIRTNYDFMLKYGSDDFKWGAGVGAENQRARGNKRKMKLR